MKKLLMMTTIAATLAAFAQEVPAPVTVPTAPAPATTTVGTATGALADTEPGAICKTYLCNTRRHGFFSSPAEELENFLKKAKVTDQGYDVKATKFHGEDIAKHAYNAVVWEGYLNSPVAGDFTFTITAASGLPYIVGFNGQSWQGGGQNTIEVTLKKGLNAVYIATGMGKDSSLRIDYRLSNSKKAAKPLTPQNLMHIVEDEENWEFLKSK